MIGVEAALDPFLSDIAIFDPTLLAAFHLVGSAMQGDFQPHGSDIDFVGVLSRRPNPTDLAALATAHRTYASRVGLPFLDGIWITEADLAAGPQALPDGPTTQDSVLMHGQGNRNPITWLMLRDQAETMVGAIDRQALWHDTAALNDWLRNNANTYWRGWLARSSMLLSGPGFAMLGRNAPMWGMLGISRQHYTLANGKITSKSGAGRYARDTFGRRWHKIIDECLAIRSGASTSTYANSFARRRDALDFMAMAIDAVVNFPRSDQPTSE